MTYLGPQGYPADASKSPNPDAAKLLCTLMGDISEELWCAGWLIGTEQALWSMVNDGDRSWGMGEVSEQEVAELKRLSERCGGWIVWEDKICERWIPIADWVARIQEAGE